MKHLEVHPHPVCCGIQNIGYFGFSTTNVNSMGTRPLNELETDLLEAENYVGIGTIIVTLNEEQVPHVEYLLEKHGYTCVVKDAPGRMTNSSTGRKFTNNIYVKCLTKNTSTKLGDVGFHERTKRINNETPGKTEAKPVTAVQSKTQYLYHTYSSTSRVPTMSSAYRIRD